MLAHLDLDELHHRGLISVLRCEEALDVWRRRSTDLQAVERSCDLVQHSPLHDVS